MKKILCVIDSLRPGGAQRQLVELAVGFKEKGHHVSFLIYHRMDFYRPVLEAHSIPITCLDDSRYLNRFLKMRKHIRSGGFDVVLSFLQGPNFVCETSGFPFRSWKLIVGERSANPNMFKSLKLRIFRFFHFFADYIVANSHENMNMVRRINPLLSQRKCKVIYNLVHPDWFKYAASYAPLKNGKLNIAVGASHRSLKNCIGLLKALKSIPVADREKFCISWFGDSIVPPYLDSSYQEVLDYIDQNDLDSLIKFYPATHNIREYMYKADVVGLFSFYEGFPNIICEAMALGKPVMVSRVSDITLILSDKYFQTFEPTDTSSIVGVLLHYSALSTIELSQIGSHNRCIAMRYFDKDVILNEYLQLMA